MNTDLEKRLNNLPRKIAQPFRQLLAAGLLNDETLSTVLDAGDLSGDYNRLTGFAIGFLYLRSQRIPVHDVIAMAKQQNRRINLNWGEKRWKSEHEKLSRAQTLEQLARENTHYDLSAYEEHLPEHFDGYLIRSSRRLGMEGLRQRHCVASYHDRIHAGRCAIACVFVDKRRWTVELIQTYNQDTPLRINQIKSRYNESPTGKVREAIFKTLSIDPKQEKNNHIAPRENNHTYLDTLQRLLPILREHNVEIVTVTFDGGGDEGHIDGIHYDPIPDTDPTTVMVEHLVSRNHFEEGQWITTRELQETTLNEAIDELTYDYLQETGIDWCNNDGGYGDLIINILRETVELNVHVRYTESATEYAAERNIFTGEDV